MCTTSHSHQHGCPGLHMDIGDLGGGAHGAEVITCDNPGNFYYLIFVHESTRVTHSNSLTGSGVRIALYGITGQVVRFDTLPIDPHGHSRCVTTY